MSHVIPQPPSNDPLSNGIAVGIAIVGLAVLVRQTWRNHLTSRWWQPVVGWTVPGVFAGLLWVTMSPVGSPFISWSPLVLFVAWTWGVMLAIQRTTLLRYAGRHAFLPGFASFAVGMVVLGVLLSPAVMQARNAARRGTHKCSLSIIGLALHNYHDTYQSFPMPAIGEPPHSWRVAVLPFVDAADLYQRYDFAASWDSDENEPIARTPQRTCHRREDHWHDQLGRYYAYIAMITGPGTIWEDGQPVTADDIADADGLSNTILAGEAVGWKIVWTEPRDVDVREATWDINRPGPLPDVSDSLLSSTHEGGAYALFADGTTRFLSQKIDPAVLKTLVTANGGEKVGDFWP
jgi:hypothetical protein